MELLTDIRSLKKISGPVCLAIGVFDGLHKGHQEVIGRAAAAAGKIGGTIVVVTFDPHPRTVLSGGDAPRLLVSTRHKLLLLERLGVGHVLLIHFDEDFSTLSAEGFVRQLAEANGELRQVTVGSDWNFGHRRSGDLKLLKNLGESLGFEVAGVSPVCESGEVISSTAIRRAVEEGDLDKARRLLGRDYTVLGTVVEGDQRGRTIGYPTANLSVHNEQLPPSGVYAVKVALDSGSGAQYIGLANLGYRPTVKQGGARRSLEVFLLDFDREIYGEDLELTFVEFLREERKFDSLEALKTQIGIDEATVRQRAWGSAPGRGGE